MCQVLHLNFYYSQNNPMGKSVTIPILLMRGLRLREVK